MTEFDITLLTDPRYHQPKVRSSYINNVLLEDRLLMESLTKLRLRVHRVPWSAAENNWASSRFAIFRSTWDYYDHLKEFKLFIQTSSSQVSLINPRSLLEWNLDKHYLRDLQKRGINIPPTVFIEAGSQTSLEAEIRANAWDEVVLKPAIAASGRHTYRFKLRDATAHEHVFQQLIENEAMLIQEFQRSVPNHGEIALMYFNGSYSHAVLKRAKPGDFRVQDDFGGTVHNYKPTENELALGTRALAACNPMPIYARVDIIKDNKGNSALTELELIEPELWLRKHRAAADNFANAVSNYVSSSLSELNR